jgi:hypothetical protein
MEFSKLVKTLYDAAYNCEDARADDNFCNAYTACRNYGMSQSDIAAIATQAMEDKDKLRYSQGISFC